MCIPPAVGEDGARPYFAKMRALFETLGSNQLSNVSMAVSYTHLDVYKRQTAQLAKAAHGRGAAKHTAKDEAMWLASTASSDSSERLSASRPVSSVCSSGSASSAAEGRLT